MEEPYKIPQQNQKPIISVIKDKLEARDNLQIARFQLSSAQILALKTTPVTILTSFVHSLIIIEGITARLVYGGTAYTGTNALEFRYTNASGAKVTADISTTFLNSAANAYSHVAGVVTELVPLLGPIVVCVPTADPGAGNSTIDLFIRYRLASY